MLHRPAEEADAIFAPIAAFGRRRCDGVQPMPFPALQGASTGSTRPGYQWYWKADFVDELSDEAIERARRATARRLPTLQSTMHLYPIDGAAPTRRRTTPRSATAARATGR